MLTISSLKTFIRVNTDIFIRMICVIFVFTFFTSKSAAIDNTTLAINTLLLQFLMIYSYLIDGFAYAAEAIIGKLIGANDSLNLKKSIKTLFIWGIVLSLPFTIIYFFWGDKLLLILSNNMDIIEASKPYLFWITLIPVLSFAAFLWDGIYIGATASKAMRNTMLVATVLFFPVAILLYPSIGNHSLWLAILLFLAGRGISQTIIASKAIYSKI